MNNHPQSDEAKVTNHRFKGRSAWVRIICALALLMVSFAHKPLGISDKLAAYAGVDVAEYILPDGTLPDLCLTGENHDEHHTKGGDCEACRISSSSDLPLPVSDISINSRFAVCKPAFLRSIGFAHTALRPGASPRAPPANHA